MRFAITRTDYFKLKGMEREIHFHVIETYDRVADAKKNFKELIQYWKEFRQKQTKEINDRHFEVENEQLRFTFKLERYYN
jgi:hypothetical protein